MQIITSALAGYALARMKFRGREAILLLIIATLVIPFQLLVIPIFVVLKWGHLINTYLALITLFLFTFIAEWNDLFKPLVFTTRPELRTVQLALAEFQEQFTNSWPLMMAGVVIATIPVVLLFLAGQRQFIQGIGSTGIKN